MNHLSANPSPQERPEERPSFRSLFDSLQKKCYEIFTVYLNRRVSFRSDDASLHNRVVSDLKTSVIAILKSPDFTQKNIPVVVRTISGLPELIRNDVWAAILQDFFSVLTQNDFLANTFQTSNMEMRDILHHMEGRVNDEPSSPEGL